MPGTNGAEAVLASSPFSLSYILCSAIAETHPGYQQLPALGLVFVAIFISLLK